MRLLHNLRTVFDTDGNRSRNLLQLRNYEKTFGKNLEKNFGKNSGKTFQSYTLYNK